MSGFGTISSHKAYRISFYQVPGVRDVEVDRRYSDFEWLRQQLMVTFPAVLLPALPPKILRIQLERSSELMEERRKGFQDFLREVADLGFPVASMAFQAFVSWGVDLQNEKKKAENAMRNRTPESIAELFQAIFPEATGVQPPPKPQAVMFGLKDFLATEQVALRRCYLAAERQMDKLLSLKDSIESFTKALDDYTRLDDTLVDNYGAKRTDCKDFFNFAASTAGCGVEAWDTLASCLHRELYSVPRMQEVITGWSNLQGSRRNLHLMPVRASEFARSKSISDLRSVSNRVSLESSASAKEELFDTVTNVVLWAQQPLWWQKNTNKFNKGFSDFSAAEIARHKTIHCICYNEAGERRQFGRSLESLPSVWVDGFGDIPEILDILQDRLLTTGGLTITGIFRISAKRSQIDTWRAWSNQNLDSLRQLQDPHVASNLIKLFFRSLPTPLLDAKTLPVQTPIARLPKSNPKSGPIPPKSPKNPSEMEAKELGKSETVEEEGLVWDMTAGEDFQKATAEYVNNLDPRIKSVVLWLFHLSSEVALLQDVNRMSIDNMATVLAPNLVSFSPTALVNCTRFFKTGGYIYFEYLTAKIKRDEAREEARRKAEKEERARERIRAEKEEKRRIAEAKKRESGKLIRQKIKAYSQQTKTKFVTARRRSLEYTGQGVSERSGAILRRMKEDVKGFKPEKKSEKLSAVVKDRIATARSHFSQAAKRALQDSSNARARRVVHGSITGRSLFQAVKTEEKSKQDSKPVLVITEDEEEKDDKSEPLPPPELKESAVFKVAGLGPLAEFYAWQATGGPKPREQLLKSMRMRSKVRRSTLKKDLKQKDTHLTVEVMPTRQQGWSSIGLGSRSKTTKT
uniref:PX domain-containing protein n=1 Tax=Amorphochlora amoebiformis TaxID=1561963 RepID=A0A7S0CQR0_9EUKA